MAAPRVKIPIIVLKDANPTFPVEGAEVFIKFREGAEAPVYKNSGATNETLSQPLSTAKTGAINGWLPRGSYEVDITIPGETPFVEYLDIAPGSEKAVETAWIAEEAITGVKVSSAIKDAAAGTASLRTLGTGEKQATAGNDSRLSNERTPTANSVTTAKIAKEAITEEKLGSGAVTKAKLATGIGAFTWYTPKIILTEQSTSSTSFVTLSTPDEITGVVVPSNGVIFLLYQAVCKSSVKNGGQVTIFLNSTEVKTAAPGFAAPAGVSIQLVSPANIFNPISSSPVGGLARVEPLTETGYTGDVTTGQVFGVFPPTPQTTPSGPCQIFVNEGTYNVSIKWKASSGSVTAKERRLLVGVMG